MKKPMIDSWGYPIPKLRHVGDYDLSYQIKYCRNALAVVEKENKEFINGRKEKIKKDFIEIGEKYPEAIESLALQMGMIAEEYAIVYYSEALRFASLWSNVGNDPVPNCMMGRQTYARDQIIKMVKELFGVLNLQEKVQED